MHVAPVQSLCYNRTEIVGLPKPVKQVVKEVALVCFKELGVSLLMGSTVALFVPSSVGLGFLGCALGIQMVAGVIFHSMAAFAHRKAEERGKWAGFFGNLATVSEYLAGINFSLLTGFNAQNLVHEGGHALAAQAVYKNQTVQITILPFLGGTTAYFKHLNLLGKALGAPTALAIVLASGPAMSVVVSGILLVVGLNIKEKYPMAGKYLVCYSLLDFLHTAHYAFSTVYSDPFNLAHDFVHLGIFGVNPVSATLGIIAVPQLISAGVHLWNQRKREPTNQVAPVPILVHGKA